MPATLPLNQAASRAPILLFVHGFRCDHSDWDGIIARLSPRFDCRAFDLPGHGQSPSDGMASVEGLGAAVNRVRAEVAGRDVVLIGHSLGAKVIREAYRQQPEAIAGMILIDSSLYESDRETMVANASQAVAAGMEPFLRALFSRMFFTPPDADWYSAVLARALTGDLEFARRLFLDSVEWDVAHALATIRALKVPSLVIQSTTFDAAFRWRPLGRGESTPLIDTMRRELPDFRAEIIDGAGHFIMQDAPDQVARAIAAFTNRLRPQGATATFQLQV